MEAVMKSALLLLLAQGSLAQNGTNSSIGDGVVTATPSTVTTGDDRNNTDYVSMLRAALGHGFANVPTSVKVKLLRAGVSPDCRMGLLRTLRAFLNLETWALRLFDASGKYPTGLFQGSRADMGAFDECLETVVHDKNGNILTRGQYCNLVAHIKNSTAVEGNIEALSNVLHPKILYFKNYFSLKDTTFFRLGICFIEECSQDDLQALVDSIKPPLLHLEISNCVTAEPEPWTLTQITITFILGALLVIVIAATTTDHIMKMRPKDHKKRSTLHEFVTAFSVTSNTRDLLKVADKSQTNQYAMQFLHGMRFFCIIHIVIGHFYTTLSDSWSRLLNMLVSSDEWTHMIAAAGFNSVDTFFFLSGFFLCFTVSRQKRNGPIVFIVDVIKRLIRICFPLFFVIMCFYLLPRVVNGPDARAGFQKMFDEITNHWWQLLLQIRNFYETTVSDVLVHTWYLSADFQLYLVSLLTLLILKGHKTAVVAAFTVFSLIGCAFGMWVLVSRDLLPFQIFPGPDMPLLTRTLSEFYVRPYYHAVCYFSGCMTFLLMGDFRKRKITKGTQLAGWCVSVSCGLISVFAKLAWYRSPNPTSEAVTLLAAFFDRILWSVFIVWITLACASGRGGFVARFLSWNAFVPLSKLSFGVYLIHLPFIQLMLHASRERVLWSKFNLVTLWLSVVVWSFLLSYLTFLACEAPTAKLNSLIFGRIVGRGDPRKQKQPEQSA